MCRAFLPGLLALEPVAAGACKVMRDDSRANPKAFPCLGVLFCGAAIAQSETWQSAAFRRRRMRLYVEDTLVAQFSTVLDTPTTEGV